MVSKPLGFYDLFQQLCSLLHGLEGRTKLCQLRLGQPDPLLDLVMMLLLLLQHSAIKLVLSGLSGYVSKVTGLVAGRLTALRILISLTAPLRSARDRLGARSCGGLGGGGVWPWLGYLQSRSYLSLLSSLV